ncbi:pre-mRNA-splicing factor cwc15 [Drechslerella stenobrocha 248]|uniref:Pre-mRNA-splicing factor cwc15 n=1 Tax=Drechslerella stenobrocha 248 TaxID=1043628 RepID=W7HWQ2_9PEZI|nr:pre-mRNA-splicing factor cwc15 [Drechslerella stenobrocha 248]
MTTAHRPTFDPAQGKETRRGPVYHQRLLPAHTLLKVRKPGQGGDADAKRDLRAELLKAEAAHYAKVRGEDGDNTRDDDDLTIATATTRKGDRRDKDAEDEDETPEAKRRRILEESRDLDADSDGSGDEDGSDASSSDEDSDDEDSEDETAELMRELEKIKKERAAAKEKEEREQAAEEEAQREVDIARGNPLLNPKSFNVKRRWDDDVIFKNQARGVQEKGKRKEFVNDLLRSDFHRKFMNKYVR